MKVDEKDEFGNERSQAIIEAERETKLQATYESIADNLSQILDIDRREIEARLQKTKSAYEVLAEKVEDDVADQVRAYIDENDLETCIYLTEPGQPGGLWPGEPVQHGAVRPGRADHHRQERPGHRAAHPLHQL